MSFRRRDAGLLAWLVAASSLAAAADCDLHALQGQLGYVSNYSEWSEVDIAGRKLDRESGVLSGPEFAARWRCEDWTVQGQMARLDGTRVYDGQTSLGVPVMSQSGIGLLQGHLQASVKFDHGWQAGVRLSGQTLWRDIASAGGASGYPERYDWQMLSVGALWQTAVGPGELDMDLWFGQSLWARMELNFPGYDTAFLSLGTISQTELGIAWSTVLSPSWRLRAGVRYRRTEMGKGPDTVLMRSGLPAGMAHQPATSMIDVPVTVGITYQF